MMKLLAFSTLLQPLRVCNLTKWLHYFSKYGQIMAQIRPYYGQNWLKNINKYSKKIVTKMVQFVLICMISYIWIVVCMLHYTALETKSHFSLVCFSMECINLSKITFECWHIRDIHTVVKRKLDKNISDLISMKILIIHSSFVKKIFKVMVWIDQNYV